MYNIYYLNSKYTLLVRMFIMKHMFAEDNYVKIRVVFVLLLNVR